MSHTVEIRTVVRDTAAIALACTRLGLPAPITGEHELFDGQRATGTAVRLKDWSFPVVCDTKTGKLSYDNYGGYWGKQAELDKFLQAYGVEKAKIECRKKGLRAVEKTEADGSITLTMQGV